MTPSEVADVEGVLVTLGCLVLLALVGVSLTRSGRARLAEALAGTATGLATAVAALATAGSLWFSERAGFPPCELCWYQRIAMYPLVVVLGIAAARRSATGRITGLTIAAIGLLVSIWHNIIETYPSISTGSCDPTNPCTIRWVEGLGFWTIPRMAAASFTMIIGLTLIDHLAQPQTLHPSPKD